MYANIQSIWKNKQTINISIDVILWYNFLSLHLITILVEIFSRSIFLKKDKSIEIFTLYSRVGESKNMLAG